MFLEASKIVGLRIGTGILRGRKCLRLTALALLVVTLMMAVLGCERNKAEYAGKSRDEGSPEYTFTPDVNATPAPTAAPGQ